MYVARHETDGKTRSSSFLSRFTNTVYIYIYIYIYMYIYIFVFRQIVLSEQSIVMCIQIEILLLSYCVLYIPY